MIKVAAEDLVVRLLGAIDEREAVAREAAKYSAEEWTTASSAVLDLGLPDLDGLIPLPASPIGHHMEANDPRAVLRLCQSHRDILDQYQKAVIHERWLQANHIVGRNPSLGFELGQVVKALARGYGLEEE